MSLRSGSFPAILRCCGLDVHTVRLRPCVLSCRKISRCGQRFFRVYDAAADSTYTRYAFVLAPCLAGKSPAAGSGFSDYTVLLRIRCVRGTPSSLRLVLPENLPLRAAAFPIIRCCFVFDVYAVRLRPCALSCRKISRCGQRLFRLYGAASYSMCTRYAFVLAPCPAGKSPAAGSGFSEYTAWRTPRHKAVPSRHMV